MAKVEISVVTTGLGIFALTTAGFCPSPPTQPADHLPAAPRAPSIVLGGNSQSGQAELGLPGAPLPPICPSAACTQENHLPARSLGHRPSHLWHCPSGGAARPPWGRTQPAAPAMRVVAMSQAVTPAGGQAGSRPGHGGRRAGAGS